MRTGASPRVGFERCEESKWGRATDPPRRGRPFRSRRRPRGGPRGPRRNRSVPAPFPDDFFRQVTHQDATAAGRGLAVVPETAARGSVCVTQLDDTSEQRTVGPPIRPKPATLHIASIPKERATGGRISPSVACADGRVATRRFGRGPGHLSVIGAWSKAEAVRNGPPKAAPGASSSLPPAPGTATPRGTGSAVIRGSSRCSPKIGGNPPRCGKPPRRSAPHR